MDSLDGYAVTFMKSLIDERIGRARTVAAIHQLVAALDEHRDIWGWGDGYGGWVKEVLQAQIESVGLQWEPQWESSPRDRRKVQVLERDEYTCQNCGIYDEYCHVDHILPKSRGGSNDIENLQALCAKCNSSKGALTMEEWEETGRAAKMRGES